MDAISTWAKENFDLISLLVGIIAVKAGFNALEYGSLEMQKSALQAEIEQLKKQL